MAREDGVLSDIDFDPFDFSFDFGDKLVLEDRKQIEQSQKEEFSQIKKDFADRGKKEQERFQLSTDSEFWVCFVFPSREHCDEFLKNSGIDTEDGDKYVDGITAAKAMGIKINLPIPDFPKQKKDKVWGDFPSIDELLF
jgi:hypothetical protein